MSKVFHLAAILFLSGITSAYSGPVSTFLKKPLSICEARADQQNWANANDKNRWITGCEQGSLKAKVFPLQTAQYGFATATVYLTEIGPLVDPQTISVTTSTAGFESYQATGSGLDPRVGRFRYDSCAGNVEIKTEVSWRTKPIGFPKKPVAFSLITKTPFEYFRDHPDVRPNSDPLVLSTMRGQMWFGNFMRGQRVTLDNVQLLCRPGGTQEWSTCKAGDAWSWTSDRQLPITLACGEIVTIDIKGRIDPPSDGEWGLAVFTYNGGAKSKVFWWEYPAGASIDNRVTLSKAPVGK